MKALNILFASRSIESPATEGGFVLLKDIASEICNDPAFDVAMLSSSRESVNNIRPEKVFSKNGWSKQSQMQFPYGVWKKSRQYNIVHTAHIPTLKNAYILKRTTKKAQASGTKFLQTITGMPKIADNKIDSLLWGDHIVAQSPEIYRRITKQTYRPVSMITPWPSPSRIEIDDRRIKTERAKLLDNKEQKLIVFPGEFRRLGVTEEFSACIDKILARSPNTKIVLACRFDKDGIGTRLAEKYPKKVISVAETTNILDLLNMADLVIYPAKTTQSKFQPPLVIMEALSMGTPVIVSSNLDIETDCHRLLANTNIGKAWTTFSNEINEQLLAKKGGEKYQKNEFYSMIDEYKSVYSHIMKG